MAQRYIEIDDVPGLLSFVQRKQISNLAAVSSYINAVWGSKQGDVVGFPTIITSSEANEICSLVLDYRERQRKQGGTVEIKKVAEIRGSRFNTGKLRMDLIDPSAMEGLAAVLSRGAEKYTAHNWRQGLPYMEIIASMQRHIMRIAAGEDTDPETGLPHADHVQCNAMFLSNMMKTRPDMDDRWKPPVVDAS